MSELFREKGIGDGELTVVQHEPEYVEIHATAENNARIVKLTVEQAMDLRAALPEPAPVVVTKKAKA